MIVAVINQKGGAGKTTIALNLAAAWSEKGRRVLLADADPQQTAQDWAAACQGVPGFQVIGMSKPVLHRDLPGLAADYDDIIVDGAPRAYEVARSAIGAADLVLIPVQPSGADLWATRETVKLVREVRDFKGTQKAVFVISRKIGRTALARDIETALAEFDIPVLKASTTQRIVYAEALSGGTTVIGLQPKGPAATEIRAIAIEVRKMGS
jgi:chromosome partitioning protein